jgi:SAM-dependent methyltransferase
MKQTLKWYDNSYATKGLAAQRRYPNEELLRFLAAHFFQVAKAQRSDIKILEVGCGSGANLWVIAHEGFDAYGLDLSDEALKLCEAMLGSWGVAAKLSNGSMTTLPYPDSMFDAAVDVFSSYCLNEGEFDQYLNEVARTLKPGGRYFSYAPSTASTAFTDHSPASMIDSRTLDGIRRESSPYSGNLYPFRFISSDEYAVALDARGFAVTANEKIGRTYRGGEEYFEFVSIAAQKR